MARNTVREILEIPTLVEDPKTDPILLGSLAGKEASLTALLPCHFCSGTLSSLHITKKGSLPPLAIGKHCNGLGLDLWVAPLFR